MARSTGGSGSGDAATAATVPEPAGPAGSPRPSDTLLAAAWALLGQARATPVAVERYRIAHRAALRGAVAAVGTLADPTPGRAGQRAVWSVLAERAPELTEWAWFLAVAARGAQPRRPEPGVVAPAAVAGRDADDLVRQVEQFLVLLARRLDRPRRDAPVPGAARRSA